MQADRWKQVEKVFEAAQQRPPRERRAFLKEVCGGDDELCTEVESLLKASDSSNALLDGSPLSSIIGRAPLKPGDKLANFEILVLLGRGGMGEVWRGHDPRLKRDVAVKVLPPLFARDPERVARFEREARAVGALNHPNIATVHDIGRDHGSYWIATELVEGEPLSRIIGRGPLKARKAVDFGVQIADGLSAAHAAGIVHRDLKPANIMISREGRVKIVDFGLAKRRRTESGGTGTLTAELTDSNTILGTAAYMSPEQVRGEDADHRSDIFSLGLILYELLAGKRPFAGDSSIQVMNAILTQEVPDLSVDVPPPVARTICHSLEKEPGRRFQSAADLSFALASASIASGTVAPRRKSYRWLPWAAVALISTGAAVAAYWWGARYRPAAIGSGTVLRRLTNDDGLTTDATLSSDGKLVAYASDRGNPRHLDIWVQRIDGGKPLRLTDGPADNYDPSISPGGSQVAFRSERGGGGIYVIPLLGGDARLLIPKGNRPRYSPDGQMMMYSVHYPNDYDALFVQRLSGGSPIRIGDGCDDMVPPSAVWSPGGSRIMFDAVCASSHGVWIFTSDGHRIGQLPAIKFVIDQWLAKPARLLIPFNSSSAETSDEASIRVLPISNDGTKIVGPEERLTFGTGTERHAYAAGGRIALSTRSGARHIWGISVDTKGHPQGPPKQLTFGEGGQILSYLSRDGRKLTFNSERLDHLYYKALQTGKVTDLPLEGETVIYSVISPDANEVIFASSDPSRRETHIFREAISGALPKKIWGALPARYSVGVWDWSPDGSTLLWFNGGVVGQLDLNSLTATKFLEDPDLQMWQAHFSPDGRWVTFNGGKDPQYQVFVAPFRKGLVPRSEWIPVAESGDKPHFSANGKQIFFGSERDGFWCIWAQAVTPEMHPVGAPFAVLHAHERRTSFRNMGVDDGRSIAAGPNMLMFERLELTGNVWLMEQSKEAR